MFKAALKSLMGRKVRLMLSTAAIVLGVAFVAGSLVFIDTLNRSLTALFASTVGDVVVRPVGSTDGLGQAGSKTLPASMVDKLRKEVPDAARVDGQINMPNVVILGRNGKVVGGYGMPSFGANWTTAPAGHGLEGMTITEGRPPRKTGEVVLDIDTAIKGGYGLGSKVPIISSTQKDPMLAKLVGTAEMADGGSLNGTSLVYFDTRTAQKILFNGREVFNNIWVTAPSTMTQDELQAQVAKTLPKGVEAITGDKLSEANATFLLEALKFLTIFLLIFAAISVVVGAFLIVNTFSMLVAQRSRELALLRALGASGQQVTGSVLIEALLIGLVGSTVGIGVGILLAMGIVRMFSKYGLDISRQSLVFEPNTFIAAYVVGVLVTMFAAWLPARRTAKIAPIQALRDDVAMPESSLRGRFIGGVSLVAFGFILGYLGLFTEIPHGGYYLGAGALAVLLGVTAASPVLSWPFLTGSRAALAGGFGTVGNLAGQNSLRNPRRTTVTASALMIGLAVAGTMTILADSAKTSIDRTISENFVGDYVVRTVNQAPFNKSVGDKMANVKGVTSVTRERWAWVTREDVASAMVGVEATSLKPGLGVQMLSGKTEDLGLNKVLISDAYARKLKLGTGDSMNFTLNGVKKTMPIVGVFKETPMVMFPFVTVPETLTKAGYPDQDNMLVISVKEQSKKLEDQLNATVTDLPLLTISDQVAYAQQQRAPIDQMVSMIFALLGLALIIAVLGIVNTLALSVIERTREVGLLRAVGLTKGQIRVMVTLESVVISSLGAILGLAMGLLFGAAAVRALADQGLRILSVPWNQLALYLLLAVVVGVLAAVLPARRAANLNVLGAIAHD